MLWLILYAAFLLIFCARHLGASPLRDSFYVCDRDAGTFTVTLSLLASSVGGTATIGMIGLAWQAGWAAVWWLGSGVIGFLLLGALLASKIRASACRTLPQLVELYLGPRCRMAAAIIIIASSIAIVAAQFSALALLLVSLSGLSFHICLLTGVFCLALYTWAGGQYAVMKSDTWQFGIMVAALLLGLGLFLEPEPCKNAIKNAPFALFNSHMSPERAIYFLLVFGSSFFIGPMLSGRLLSARSPKVAKKSAFLAAFGLALITCMVVVVGIAISGLELDASSQDQALFAAMTASLPPWAAITLTLGLVAAVVSSADSCLFTAASIWANDIIRNPTVKQARRAVSVLSACSLALVFWGKNILGYLLAASDIYACGIVCPALVAMLSEIRGSRTLFYWAMSLGGACGFMAALTGEHIWSYLGLGISAMLSLGGIHKCKNQRRSDFYKT